MIKKFTDFVVKNRRRLIIGISALLMVIGLTNFYFIFNITLQPNDECLWEFKRISPDSAVYVFDEVKFEGVTWDAGIRDGDHLLALNGVHSADPILANRILIEDEDKSVDYKIWRNGRVFHTTVEVKELIQFEGLGAALLAFIWFIVGFIVVMVRPHGITQLLFFRIGGAFILYSMFNLEYFLNGYNPLMEIPWLLYTIDTLKVLGSMLLPFLVLHFFWVFPLKVDIIDKKYTLWILYTLPVLLTIFLILIKVTFVGDNIVFYALAFQGFFNFLILISSIIGIVFLFRSYIKLTNPSERNAVFIILVAYAIGIASMIFTFWIAEAITDNVYNSPQYFAPIVLIALVPVSFGYSIFRYSLMDVSDVVKNTILYGAATVSLAGLYFLIIYLAGQQISMAIGTEYQAVIAAAIFIFFALVFQSSKDRMQELITRKFYPEQFAYQRVLLNFSADIAMIVGLENILRAVDTIFTSHLKIRKFEVYLKKNGSYVECINGAGATVESSEEAENRILRIIERKKQLGQRPVIERSDFEKVFPNHGAELQARRIYTVIPMIIRSRITGFLMFGLKPSGSQLSGKDLEILSATSSQIAVSLENARLYESEAEKKKLDRDLENARRIQKNLLPVTVPSLPGVELSGAMIPAMQVGGDYYDFIKVSDSKIFVIVGDVSGKGLSASFYMSKLQTMVHLFCREGRSPKEILTEINKYLYGSIEKNWFITAALALIDTEAGTIRYCRAGHTPLLLISDNHKLTFQPPGIGLGLDGGDIFDKSLDEIELKLKNGEIYVLYSDGVVENFNPSDEIFGEDRFYNILTANSAKNPAQLQNRVLKEIDNFRGSRPQYDDITLVIISYNKPTP